MRTSLALKVPLVALLFALCSWAPAQATGVTQLSGLLEPDRTATECTELGPGFIVTGDLTGCWYITSITKEKINVAGGYQARGTETFIGCLGDRCGEFFTTFTFTAKFLADGSEAHGRCNHPVIGGTGGFAGVSGVFNMHDLPDGCAVYKGHLTFSG